LKFATSVVGTDVVQRSEHPITLDESSANVESIQEKLSYEAFDSAQTRLLTCKNVLLADVDGTRGKVSTCYTMYCLGAHMLHWHGHICCGA